MTLMTLYEDFTLNCVTNTGLAIKGTTRPYCVSVTTASTRSPYISRAHTHRDTSGKRSGYIMLDCNTFLHVLNNRNTQTTVKCHFFVHTRQ